MDEQQDPMPEQEATIDINHLARLARLSLSDEEQKLAGDDLGRIIRMIDQMQEVDTSGVQPMANPLDAHQRLRADQVTEDVDAEHFQKNAPAKEDGYYLVPKVVE